MELLWIQSSNNVDVVGTHLLEEKWCLVLAIIEHKIYHLMAWKDGLVLLLMWARGIHHAAATDSTPSGIWYYSHCHWFYCVGKSFQECKLHLHIDFMYTEIMAVYIRWSVSRHVSFQRLVVMSQQQWDHALCAWIHSGCIQLWLTSHWLLYMCVEMWSGEEEGNAFILSSNPSYAWNWGQ